MHIVLGATGHVGSAAVEALLEAGEKVTGITHDEHKAAAWRARGAEMAVLDVTDPDALRSVFRRGRRAFLLNPPAAPAPVTDATEEASARAIAAALDGSGLEKVVVESTYGAQPGQGVGDLSVLYHFEERVTAAGIPAAIDRAAYYFSNFDGLLEAARGGELPSMFPADMVIPMAAPADLGRVAAHRLLSGLDDTGPAYVEGPRRYTFDDAAAAFSAALGRPVSVRVIPRGDWEATYRRQGFSEAAARAYARMTAVSLEGFDLPEHPWRGDTRLEDYIRDLVQRSGD